MRRILRICAISPIFAIAQIGFALPTNCPNEAVEITSKQVQTARKHLLALSIGDGMQTDVSSDAQKEIAAMKAALEEFMAASMRCAGVNPNAEELKKEMSADAHAFALEKRSYSVDELPKDANNYGFQLEFDVRRMPGHSNLIGITATFQIKCGMDSVLVLFAPEDGTWKEVLRWTSPPYKTVAGAFWSFDYAVSPPDESGQWFLVAKSIDPWCSSTWSTIRYSVLRPVAGSLNPERVFSGSDFMWWGNDDYGELSADTDRFDLRFHAASIDGGIHNRIWIRDFSVIGKTVQRIPPVAESPRDFVDEWIVSSWKDAAAWSATKSLPELRRAHDLVHKQFGEFDSVRKCADSADHYQVALKNGKGDQLMYFQVSGRKTTFTMRALGPNPQAGCDGPDILDSMATQ